MTSSGKKMRKASICLLAGLMAGTLAASQFVSLGGAGGARSEITSSAETPTVTEYKGDLLSNAAASYDPSVVQKLPKGLDSDREISVIVRTTESGLLNSYNAQSGVSAYGTVADYANSAKGMAVSGRIEKANNAAKTAAELSGVKFTYGADYETFFGGFEAVMKAGDYAKFASALRGTAYEVSISEEYAECETEIVENDVHVYESGIFDSSDSEYDGTGTVVAVLDTGLDYTHSVFDPEVFKVPESKLRMTMSSLAGQVPGLRAAEYTDGLTAAKVYLNPKVPYAYDYADKDYDVYPLESEHGTHVSGVILGNNVGSSKNKPGDPEIVGVAPNAQLVMMKTFSDKSAGARWSWILAALEDCVRLDVDVINMSLGSSSGFSEAEEDEAYVYEQIEEKGISLVCAASNDHNSTYGSEKNGNLGLTTNPDSATVGSPSSYTAALSVASISGVRTPYLRYGDTNIYFTESADASSETKHFVDEILPADQDQKTFEYVIIPGTGRAAEYSGLDVHDKIVLIRRGSNTFEEKASVAASMGAAGAIIYNNVSGDITMTVGSVKLPVCSISKDNGELLASQVNGNTITISRDQTAGPFMSDFSSWGPTPDLRIKPEITAHGGDINSAVPGQAYDRLSGTSMASPNQAGVTALIRQYVKAKFPEATGPAINDYVYRIMMSTTDIARNTNGLPYSVRKQGSGLANLTKATTTPAYISTYERDDAAVAEQLPDRFTDEHNSKAKIEYGDDKQKLGSYQMVFDINNISETALTYDVQAIVMTEGISESKTARGDLTVSQEGHLLDDAVITVDGVSGEGSFSDTLVTVNPGGVVKVTATITLGENDRRYLDQVGAKLDENGKAIPVFANGMYVEGYIRLIAKSGTSISLNVPYLAFYGDWTQSPIFDTDWFETNADELDASLDTDEKTLPDAYATRPIGGLNLDYISYLGGYYFIQSAASTKISADRKYIALSNDEDAVNYIYAVWAGMLRGAKTVDISITDTTTGEVIWTKQETDQRKSYNGGSMIYYSSIEMDFYVAEHNLKNNTEYMVDIKANLDYPGAQNNVKDTFSFPFVTDFQAPVVTDVEFYTQYDRTEKKNRLYARAYIYDNHYAMAYDVGNVTWGTSSDGDEGYILNSFGSGMSQVYSGFNTTSEVIIELTDYLALTKNSYNENTFVITVYDYAMNAGTYEIHVPDEVKYLYFAEGEDGEQLEELRLNPNETKSLTDIIHIYPSASWAETLQFIPRDPEVATVLNGKVLALKEGSETYLDIYEQSVKPNPDGTMPEDKRLASLKLTVLGPEDEGYDPYDAPQVDIFRVDGYKTVKAFYRLANTDRDIGLTGSVETFPTNATMYAVSMFPSEQIAVNYTIDAYYPELTEVLFSSSNQSVVKVDENGLITAVAEGSASVSIRVLVNGESTYYDRMIRVTVKNPYLRSGPWLTNYFGGGMQSYTDEAGVVHPNTVVIPESLGFTEIYDYAFSNYEYIPKDLSAGDEITEEDPGNTKPWYIGENQDVYEVIVPNGVEIIGNYAFAGMRNLKRVVLPATVTKIAMGAFYGCTSLTEVVGLEHVKFINQSAFSGPVTANGSIEAAPLSGLTNQSLGSIIAMGDYAFYGCSGLASLSLPATAQSIGAYAFARSSLYRLSIDATRVKVGVGAFQDCSALASIKINAYAISDGVFDGCDALTTVTLGADVETIGVNAFRSTSVKTFSVDNRNENFTASTSGDYLLSKKDGGATIVYVAPLASSTLTAPTSVTKVGAGAFSGNTSVTTVNLPGVTAVEDYAFYDASSITSMTFARSGLTSIGRYAFAGETGIQVVSGGMRAVTLAPQIRTMPNLSSSLTEIADHAFSGSLITTVRLGDNIKVGEGAFENAFSLQSVTIGRNVVLGTRAFAAFAAYSQNEWIRFADATGYEFAYTAASNLNSLTIGEGTVIGTEAFSNHMSLSAVTLNGTIPSIGDRAFYNCSSLRTIGLQNVQKIGAEAFSGFVTKAYIQLFDQPERGLIEYGDLDSQAPALTSVNLSGLQDGTDENGNVVTPALGAGAFAYNLSLSSVTFGEHLAAIPANAFLGDPVVALTLGGVKEIGDSAFTGFTRMVVGSSSIDDVTTAPLFSSLDLTKVTKIGAHAFESVETLASVKLAEGAEIGDYAFGDDGALATAEGFGTVASVGAYAFAYTKISGQLDLTAATSVGDHAFLATAVSDVTFGDGLTEMGDNPFALCPMAPFTKTVDVTFNGQTIGQESLDTFTVSDTLEVIGGALYRKLQNVGGYELICYPVLGTARHFEVLENTRRIAAFAFAGNTSLVSVELPLELRAIGNKAFYLCENLDFVTFKSLKAPVLEEEYDEDYTAVVDRYPDPENPEENIYVTNIPGPTAIPIYGDDQKFTTLHIIKYDMWNISDASYFYGANFKNYIGLTDRDIVMVRPRNGSGYDSFIFGQYFGTVLDGDTAPDETTLRAIAAIAALPDTIQLTDESAVIAARALYDLIITTEQQALVSNYEKLVSAESVIAYLKGTENPTPGEDDPNNPPATEEEDNQGAIVITLSVLTGVFGAAAIAAFVLLFITKRKNGEESGSGEDGYGEDGHGEE